MIAVCGLLIGSLVISATSEASRILVLHSYATDYVWTNLTNQSLDSSFRESKFNVKIRYFYMNTRSLDYSKNAADIEQSLADIVSEFQPEVIIAMDDAAQKIISRRYLNHPDISIVFSGVNYSIEQYGYQNADNVTGIFEHKPVERIKKVLNEFNRLQEIDSPPSVLFLADNSTSSHSNSQFLSTQDWGDINYRGAKYCATFGEWKRFITQSSGKYDYILVSGYRQLLDAAGERVDSAEIANWTQVNSRAGVVGMNIFNSEDGILVSVGVSPYEQGARAFKMALQIIRGDSADEVPYAYPERYVIALSENAFYDSQVQQDYKLALRRHL